MQIINFILRGCIMNAITSIYPASQEDTINQQTAVNSWLQAGMKVFSCNIAEEREKIKNIYPKVNFITMPKKDPRGKPYMYISDMLQVMKNKRNGTCCIINSDIRLRGLKENELEQISAAAKGKLLFLRRYDIACENNPEGTYFFPGADAFFLDSQNADFFPNEGFQLGRPEWDHWIVYAAQKAGMPVQEIKNPFAFHLTHHQRWTPEQSNINAISLPDDFFRMTNKVLSDIDSGIVIDERDGIGVFRLLLREGLVLDEKCLSLMSQHGERMGYEAIKGSIGLGYFSKGKFRKICALHGVMENEYSDACMLVKKDKTETAPICGLLTAYVDFDKSGLAEKLKRFYLYPSGRAAHLMLYCLMERGLAPLGLADRDPALHGRTHCEGFPICSPQALKEADFDTLLVVSNLYSKQIADELSQIVDKQKILVI